MKRTLFAAALLALAPAAFAQDAAPKVVDPATLQFTPNPVGVLVAPGVGTGAQPGGLYSVFAKYDAGVKSLPHSHPDQRVVTVLSGVFYAGSGPEVDEKAAKPLPPGSVLIVPANAVHWGWAKDGPVLLQESGVGPTGAKIWPKTPPAK
jgi:hypothetical protein